MEFNTSSYIKKNGLIYKDDFKTIIGVDTESNVFTGRIPFGVHKITAEAFANTNYDSISLPDSVEQLGECLFENSTNLEKVKLPYSIKSLPAYIFSGCTALTKVTMPEQLTEYPEGIFYNCQSLQEIILRPGIVTIPENAFAGCTSLKSVIIPDYVQNIGKTAFANCTNVSTVILPSTIMDISPDAFEGCTNITSVRITGESRIFFIDENDGSLYEHTANGDELIIKVSSVEKQTVNFYQENADEIPDDGFFDNEEVNEIDETFSSEVDANTEEINAISGEPILDNDTEVSNNEEIQISQEEEQAIMSDNYESANQTENLSDSVIEDNVNSMLSDIMNEEKTRSESVSASVAVNEKETQILSEMMDVMNTSSDSQDNGAKVSDEELARLFSKNESQEPVGENPEVAPNNSDAIDGKTQILLSSVAFSSVVECTPSGNPPADADLFVVAEKTVVSPNGSPAFSSKLIKTAKTFAHIQDFKRIIFLNGLSFDNEEFVQFYHHFMGQKNVVFACDAPSPAKLSDYGKKVCEESRISLEKDELISQRKKISVKNNTLIKLVIQDKYEE